MPISPIASASASIVSKAVGGGSSGGGIADFVAAASQEATETKAQTIKEAASGDPTAQAKLRREDLLTQQLQPATNTSTPSASNVTGDGSTLSVAGFAAAALQEATETNAQTVKEAQGGDLTAQAKIRREELLHEQSQPAAGKTNIFAYQVTAAASTAHGLADFVAAKLHEGTETRAQTIQEANAGDPIAQAKLRREKQSQPAASAATTSAPKVATGSTSAGAISSFAAASLQEATETRAQTVKEADAGDPVAQAKLRQADPAHSHTHPLHEPASEPHKGELVDQTI